MDRFARSGHISDRIGASRRRATARTNGWSHRPLNHPRSRAIRDRPAKPTRRLRVVARPQTCPVNRNHRDRQGLTACPTVFRGGRRVRPDDSDPDRPGATARCEGRVARHGHKPPRILSRRAKGRNVCVGEERAPGAGRRVRGGSKGRRSSASPRADRPTRRRRDQGDEGWIERVGVCLHWLLSRRFRRRTRGRLKWRRCEPRQGCRIHEGDDGGDAHWRDPRVPHVQAQTMVPSGRDDLPRTVSIGVPRILEVAPRFGTEGSEVRRHQLRPFDADTTVNPSWRAASASRSSNATKGSGWLISRCR